MSFTLKYFGDAPVDLQTDRYTSGQLYVELIVNHELYAAISVCFPELTLRDDEFVFKTYSENLGLYQLLFDESLIEMVRMESTDCGMLPVCRLLIP